MSNSANLTPEQLKAIDDILGDKKQDSSFVEVEVPTQCKWYDTDSIKLRPFNFEDEKAALNPTNKNKNFLNFMLERCMEGIDIDSLYLVDRNYLAFKLKEISTGSNVTADIECTKCGRKGNLDIDLNILSVKSLDAELPLEVQLPEIGKTAKIMPPKVREEEYILGVDLLYNNIWRFVSEVGGVSDSMVITSVIEQLPVQDIHTILKAIGMSEYGMQNEINYACGCGNEQVVEVPLSENFFGDN